MFPHRSLAAYALDNVAETYRMYGEKEANRVAQGWQRSIDLDAAAAVKAAKVPPELPKSADSIIER